MVITWCGSLGIVGAKSSRMTGRTVNINLMQIISLYDKFNFHFFAGCCFGGRVLAAITLAAECVILAPVLPIFFGNPISVIIDITIIAAVMAIETMAMKGAASL